MPSRLRGRNNFQKLTKVLELSAGTRDGVFFIGRLQRGQQHAVVAQMLSEYLGSRGLHVVQHRFDRFEGEQRPAPFENFAKHLALMRRQPMPSVVVVWSLEHLREPLLIETMRKFSGRRGALNQRVTQGERSVPVVLLVEPGTYQDLAQWAGDFLDCVSSSFELSLD